MTALMPEYCWLSMATMQIRIARRSNRSVKRFAMVTLGWCCSTSYSFSIALISSVGSCLKYSKARLAPNRLCLFRYKCRGLSGQKGKVHSWTMEMIKLKPNRMDHPSWVPRNCGSPKICKVGNHGSNSEHIGNPSCGLLAWEMNKAKTFPSE